MKKFFADFKAFVSKGNVIDMAVGVVIGAAFGKIVSSLVDNIIMPALSLLTGSINLSELAFTIPSATGDPISLQYGLFLQNIIDFFIIAFTIFLCIKLIGKFRRKKEEAPAAPPEPTKEELLLTEIRDLLKEQAQVAAKENEETQKDT
ncbi:MAG: large-conductance mechanosensitive channel protein MscL [Oscillospiraceae bacterium]|nr:large-conductance mechanosensitive channel protein MscL [Oscillospiraceae bacterium]